MTCAYLAYKTGTIGERLAFMSFNAIGFSARYGRRGIDSDLRVNDLQIEVKTARQNKDSKWRATLWKRNSQNHRKSDLVILCCLHESGESWFAIPTNDILDRHHIAITSHPDRYSGRFAKYRLNKFADIASVIESLAAEKQVVQ